MMSDRALLDAASAEASRDATFAYGRYAAATETTPTELEIVHSLAATEVADEYVATDAEYRLTRDYRANLAARLLSHLHASGRRSATLGAHRVAIVTDYHPMCRCHSLDVRRCLNVAAGQDIAVYLHTTERVVVSKAVGA